MKIIAYYTKDTPYEEEALEFSKSFANENFHVFAVDNLGSWELNCGQKPKVIKQALTKYTENILYLDIDARLVGDLEPIPEPTKIGICMWNPMWLSSFTELLSGTIYFPNNTYSIKLLDEWIKTQSDNPYVWDQKNLQSIISKYLYQKLDLRWVYIDKFMRNKVKDPIILHTQCSRRLKSLIR